MAIAREKLGPETSVAEQRRSPLLDIIPVIDLMGGAVTHARQGRRDQYRPIVSPLAEGSDPLTITAAVMALAPFRRLYVADLDAIRRIGPGHDAVVAAIAAQHPELQIWVDRGDVDPAVLRRRAAEGPGLSVIGTESFADDDALAGALGAGPCVLSLDHDAAGPLGPTAIHCDPGRWPAKVIVMTLARVGAGGGPDLERLDATLAMAGGRKIYAAGGVRGPEDVVALEDRGVAGALVASALHDGRLSAPALRAALTVLPRTAPRP